ncbi:HD domain-containing protein [Actinophytocola sp. KF-1]
MSVEENTPAGEIVPVIAPDVVDAVEADVHRICTRYAARLQFHGWHHVSFVRTKAARFAVLNGAEVSVVETAALVHDVNYLVRRNSSAAAGGRLRRAILKRAGVVPHVAAWIDRIVVEAEMATRGRDISLEAQALSDADTLFKALPVTPVVLAHRYLEENGIGLRELANKICGEQQSVHDEGFYFYNPEAAEMYTRWASANLQLWQCIRESLDDADVSQLLEAVNRMSSAAAS